MTTRRRLGLLASVYLCLIAACAVSSSLALRRWDQAVSHRKAVLVAAEQLTQLRAAFGDQEMGLQGYSISGSDEFLSLYDSGVTATDALMPALQQSSKNDPELERLLEDIDRAADAWQRYAAEVVTAPHSDVADVNDQEQSVVEAKRAFDDLRGRFDTAQREFAEMADAADSDARETRRFAEVSVLAIFLVAIAFTGVAALLVRRWLTLPLAAIAQASEDLGEGRPASFQQTGPAEIRAVGRAIDRMQRTIAAQRDDAIRSREALEQSAVLALQIRSELAHELGTYPSGWTVAAGLLPAQGVVAGDCYDVGLINVNTMGIIVVDIAGHGATSAIAALKCKERLKAGLRSGLSPGDALTFLHQSDNGLDDSFLTAIVALLDTDSGVCRYANAGHPPGLVLEGDTVDHWLNPTGPLLGPIDATWRTAEVRVEDAHKLVLYTDGLVEARSPERLFFGEQGVVDTVGSARCESSQAIVKRLLDQLAEFNDGRLADDVTLVVACRELTMRLSDDE